MVTKTKTITKREVPSWKLDLVTKISNDIKKAKSLFILDLSLMPAKQLQQIKRKLQKDLTLYVARKNLLTRALKQSNLENLIPELNKAQIPAIIATQLEAFDLYKIIKQSKTPAPAKIGQKSPRDIYLEPGPTPFTPGPVIADFNKLNIKIAVESGKIAIKERKLVIKEGEFFTADQTGILSKLGVNPMELGLNTLVGKEGNYLFQKKDLDVNPDEYKAMIKECYLNARKLSIAKSIPIKETTKEMLAKLDLDAALLIKHLKLPFEESIKYLITLGQSKEQPQ